MVRVAWSLAVDFGTSNTAAAYRLDGGSPRAVRLTDQADQMPSAVLVTPDGIKVGLEAVRSAQIWPAAFEAAPKSRMGEGEIQLGGRDVPDVSLVAAVLRHVAQRAQRAAGGASPEDVVLTHPVTWAPRRQRVLRRAAAEAGLGEDVRLVPEPVAAATHYSVGRPVPVGSVVAVFDFGGGTCDVALLRSTGVPSSPFEVVEAAGEDPLGGDLLDTRLMDWTVEQLEAGGQHELVALLRRDEHVAARLTLRDQVRGAKHELSYDSSAVIPVAVAGRQQLLSLTAAELDQRLAPQLDRATELMSRTLRGAGIAPSQLAALYLTGGSSLMPTIHRRLSALLGRPAETLDDPKLVVALGALDVCAPPAAAEPAVIVPVTSEVQQDPEPKAPARRPAGSRPKKQSPAEGHLTADEFLRRMGGWVTEERLRTAPAKALRAAMKRGPADLAHMVWLWNPAEQPALLSLASFLQRVGGEPPDRPHDELVFGQGLTLFVPHTSRTLREWLERPSILEPANFVGARPDGKRQVVVDARTQWIRGVPHHLTPGANFWSQSPDQLRSHLYSSLREPR